jgi:hypothetical protein
MNATRNPDPVASERMLGKVLDIGRPMRRRAKLLERGLVVGFVAVIAAAGVFGVSLASGQSSVSPAGRGTSSGSGTGQQGGAQFQYVELYPVSVRASSSVAGHPPAAAADNDTSTYWATRSSSGSTIQGAQPGIGETLTLEFATTEKVGALAVISGAQYPPPVFTEAARPHLIELLFSSGAPAFLTLADSPAFQEFTFVPRATTFLAMRILAVYPGTAKSGALYVCAVTEMIAYARTSGRQTAEGTSFPAGPVVTTVTTTAP